jgi:hypothetical protein
MAVIYCPIGYGIILSREGGTDGYASLTAFNICSRKAVRLPRGFSFQGIACSPRVKYTMHIHKRLPTYLGTYVV